MSALESRREKPLSSLSVSSCSRLRPIEYILGILSFVVSFTQTNHVCNFITLNYTSMTHCVGIY